MSRTTIRSGDRCWKPAIYATRAAQATHVAKEVAKRCSVRANIDQALTSTRDGKPATGKQWLSSSVAGGDTGIALLCAQLQRCFPTEGWDKITHKYLSYAVKAYDYKTFDLSLYNGASGLALTAAAASQDDRHYTSLRHDLDTYLAQCVPLFLDWTKQCPGLYTASFDAICGAAGITSYLITIDKKTVSVDAVAAVNAILTYLVSLTNPDIQNNLCCFIANNHIPMPDRKQQYPNGYADTGLAHGVAGVIAALSLALLEGWSVPDMEEGLARLASWLVGQQITDKYDINWPAFIEPSAKGTRGSRSAWCYGVPGIARALYLAGTALNDSQLQKVAITAFESLIDRPRKEWGIASPNMCHGLSGILQVTLRMYQDTDAEQLHPFIEKLVDEILSLYNPETVFGFQDKNIQGVWYDNPRLLEGAPGVALALLAASQPVDPTWDRLFLIH